MKTIIYNGQIIIDGEDKVPNGYILFSEEGIIEIGNSKESNVYMNDATIDKIDAKGLWVTPGLIDTHNHGAAGHDFIVTKSEELNIVGKTMIKEGVTGFLASTTVGDVPMMAQMATRLGSYVYQDGARCLGIHMEGPYLCEKYHAMMLPEYLRDANYEEYRNWQVLSNNFVKTITMAPDREGVIDLTSRIKDEVAVMIGHTDASVQQVHQAKLAGVKGFTHFYNAMSQHEHRLPGVVTAGFIEDDLYCELICDGMHVNKDVVKMTIKQMGPKRIILITDAMPGKWMDDGRFLFCGRWVVKENGQTHLEGDTRIGGSIKPLNVMTKNVLDWCNVSINDIVQMACVNPANLIKETKKGSLHIGNDADVVIFDENMVPVHVFVEGVRMSKD